MQKADKYMSIGIVVKPQGLKGEVKFKPWSKNTQRYFPLQIIFVKQNDTFTKREVISSRFQKDMGFMLMVGSKSRESAEMFVGSELFILKKDAPELNENEFYLTDLISLNVFDEKDKHYGRIKDVLQPGGSDVYTIHCKDGDYMIPAVKRSIISVDIEAKRITINSVAWLEMAVKMDE